MYTKHSLVTMTSSINRSFYELLNFFRTADLSKSFFADLETDYIFVDFFVVIPDTKKLGVLLTCSSDTLYCSWL